MSWRQRLQRLTRRQPTVPAAEPPTEPGEPAAEPLIDVRRLIAESSLAEHCRRADAYFAQHPYPEELLQKPFVRADEAPDLLMSFGLLLGGLELFPGATVLDFGCGTCWTSHRLSQLGCRVIAADASPAALELGRELYRRHPPLGKTPPPRFLPFDGRRLDLEDGCVDRILCLDALHHVPNLDEVVAELGRVLAPGGIAGFAEPGPSHSRSPQSQSEMRLYGVIENDIDIDRIWSLSQGAGFAQLRLAVYRKPLFLLDRAEFASFLEDGAGGQRYLEETRRFLANERLFFLFKAGERPLDSRRRAGLHAELQVSARRTEVAAGGELELRVHVVNDGDAAWLPAGAGPGAVTVGCHLLTASGTVVDWDYRWLRAPLGPGADLVRPGEARTFTVFLPVPPSGNHLLELDLVSEGVCWFAHTGSKSSRLAVTVVHAESATGGSSD